jgi:hypothetical protein
MDKPQQAEVVGRTPDRCPVCGAPKAKFKEAVSNTPLVNLATKEYNRARSCSWVNHACPRCPAERERPMLNRDKLEAMLRQITDEEFNAVWRDAYGYVPSGERSDLARDFVAEQYDTELDGCIKRTEAFLNPTTKPKPNKWLAPH